MRKLEINGAIYYRHAKSGRMYLDFKRTLPVPASYFSAADHGEVIRQMQADGRKGNPGGARPNAGRKARTTEVQRNRSAMLTDSEYNYIVFKHRSFTEAVRSLFPLGWEFEEQ